MHDTASNLSHLSETPHDWEIRITAIEDFVRVGDMDNARRLVRESPDDAPVPDHLKLHLHTLLTKGKDALPPVEEVVSEGPAASKEAEVNVQMPAVTEPARSFEELTAQSSAVYDPVPLPPDEKKKAEPEKSATKKESDFSGGLAALMEDDDIPQ